MSNENETEGEIKRVTLREEIGISDNLIKLSRWKQNIPYPSSFGEWEYIPQPKIQITTNNDYIRDKLSSLSQIAAELRWIVRVIGALVLLVTAVYGTQPSLIQTSIVVFAMILLILAFFSFRVVVNAPASTATAHTPEPNISLENSDKDTN